MSWFSRRRERRLAALLIVLRERPEGWFVLDLAIRLGRRNVAAVHVDLARLEGQGAVLSWWASQGSDAASTRSSRSSPTCVGRAACVNTSLPG